MAAALDGGADVNARDDQGATPLHFAADRGHADIAGVLIAAGADVNAADEDGATPLHYAALCGNQQVGERRSGRVGGVRQRWTERAKGGWPLWH